MARALSVTVLALTIPVAYAQVSQNGVNTAILQDAGQAIAAGDFTRAETELQNLLRVTPDDFRALDLLGIVRAQQRREPEAEKLFRQVIRQKPDYASVHVHLGLLYAQMSRPDDAIMELKYSLRLSPGRTDAADALVSIWRSQAKTASTSGDLEKALALLLQARTLEPANPDAQFEYAMVALRMSLFRDARDAFLQSLKLRPDDPNAIYGLGRSYMELAKFDDARQQFERYLSVRADDASAHYALGMALVELERKSEARTEFGRSIAIRPEQTESYCQLGRLDLTSGNSAAAQDNFERVVKRDPENACALTGLGRVAFEKKDYVNAALFLQKAVAVDANIREAHYYLGLTYARSGRTADSNQELQTATRLEHEEVERQQNLPRVIGSEPPSKDQPTPK